MNPDEILIGNEKLISELLPHVQWAALAWLDECWDKKLYFKILCAYRTQDEEYALFTQGRTRDDMLTAYQKGMISFVDLKIVQKLFDIGKNRRGNIVTWTCNSFHTKRLALDLEYINCTISDLMAVAIHWNITNPIAKDPPHWQFDKIIDSFLPDPVINVTPQARLKALQARLARTQNPDTKKVIEFTISNLQRRLSLI